MFKEFRSNIRNIKKYTKGFVKNESGAELIEIAIGIVIAGGILAAVMVIMGIVNDGINNTAGSVESIFDEAAKYGEASPTTTP